MYAVHVVINQVVKFPLMLVCMLLQWGMFVTWRLAVYFLPQWLILAYFWLVGPLYSDYLSTVRHEPIPKRLFKIFLLHRDTMVLTDVVHPMQGSF